jgi:anthranilate synthase/aminodeoxychorismate synthase-like glutamine amidotransferase
VKKHILLIDNYDSFTYNLVQAFRILGAQVTIHRNDEISVADALAIDATHLVISPGPGEPLAAGISVRLIREMAGRLPIFGVCLGHQSIVAAFGGRIVHADRLMHGKTSLIEHDGRGVFAGLENPFRAGRYHSLAARREDLPAELEVSAQTPEGEVMGVRDPGLAIEGVQFHPESVLTPDGQAVINNFLDMSLLRDNEEAARVPGT